MFGWLQDLIEWLRNLLGVANQPELRWLERWVAINGYLDRDDTKAVDQPETQALLLYNEASNCPIPGIVAFWELKHVAAQNNLLLIGVNAAQLRENPNRGNHRPWRRSFELSARRALIEQKHIVYSHLFLVGWVSKTPIGKRVRIIEGQSQPEEYYQITCTQCIACDLQGMTRPWLGENKAAERVIRAIAMRALEITPSDYSTWEETLRTLDTGTAKATWLSWLRHFACENPGTRVGAGHVLQPPRSTRQQAD